MQDAERIKHQIREAFAHVEYPGDWCLRGSNEGEEPYLLEEEFKGKTDWTVLEPQFLDQAPDGFGTALSFFSLEGFHFYLPAYLIADIDDQLAQHDPTFQLTHGLTDDTKNTRVNPRRYGEQTWFDYARFKFSMFTQAEASAIVAYLQFKRDANPYARDAIDQALVNYWLGRAQPV